MSEAHPADGRACLASPPASRLVRLVLFGNGTAAALTLRAIAAELSNRITVVLVVADTSDAGEDTWRRSLVKEAESLGLPAARGNPNKASLLQRYAALHVDLFLSIQCRWIIRQGVRDIAPTYNVHNAPLPLLRGCDPMAWAIHDGLHEFGVTFHQITDDGIDSGPIIAQARWPILADTTAYDLYDESIARGTDLVLATLLTVADGTAVSVPQDNRYSTYHPMGQFDFRNSRLINWGGGASAAALCSTARANIFPPFQCPYWTLPVPVVGAGAAAAAGGAAAGGGGSGEGEGSGEGKEGDEENLVTVFVHKLRLCQMGKEEEGGAGKKGNSSSDSGVVLTVSPTLTIAAKFGGVEILQVSVGSKDASVVTGAQFAQEHQLRAGQKVYS